MACDVHHDVSFRFRVLFFVLFVLFTYNFAFVFPFMLFLLCIFAPFSSRSKCRSFILFFFFNLQCNVFSSLVYELIVLFHITHTLTHTFFKFSHLHPPHLFPHNMHGLRSTIFMSTHSHTFSFSFALFYLTHVFCIAHPPPQPHVLSGNIIVKGL